MKQYSSENFEFYLPIDYISQPEANAYIKWVEERRGKVLEYLNHQDVSDELTFPVILLIERLALPVRGAQSLTIPLYQSPIFSLFIIIKFSLLITKDGLKPLLF